MRHGWLRGRIGPRIFIRVIFLALIAISRAGAVEPARVTRLISPDGRREAHAVTVVGPDGVQTNRIAVADADGSHRRFLDVTLDAPADVTWFGPDRLAYTLENKPLANEIVDLDGRRVETLRLSDRCEPLYRAMSPDGRSVAFCGSVDRKIKDKADYGLFVVDLAGGAIRKVFGEAVKTVPAWSPDSRRLAVGGAGGYVKDYPLTIIDVAAGQAEKVGCNGVGVAWSPDGRSLAFTTEVVRGGSWGAGIPYDGRIGVWDLDAKKLTPIEPAGTNIHDKATGRWDYSGSYRPVWSPDGRRIAFRRYEAHRGPDVDEQRNEVWVANRDGSAARKVLDHAVDDLAWLHDGKTLAWTKAGHSGRVVPDDLADLGPTPAHPHGRWSVAGTVRDDAGRPLPGVRVTVSTGMGTLRPSGAVESDSEGRYTVHFDQGIMFFDDPVSLQYAIVHASKPGYYEKDLCRPGRLGMAFKKPADDQSSGYVGIVYPGHPYPLDLTMLPAARLAVRLVDAGRVPLVNFNLSLSGENFPASSILDQEKTDARGEATFDGVPLKPYRFAIGGGRSDIQSEPMPIAEPGERTVTVVYDALEATLKWETGPPSAR